jgi:hypothetical protein
MSPIRTILRAGVLAGTLDGLAAVALYGMRTGKDPVNVFKFIASGVFGKEAFAGGMMMGTWGILFHYLIAVGWAIGLFLLYPRIPILQKNKFVTGFVYGVVIWLIMNLVVLPLSNVSMRPGPKEITSIIEGMAVLIVCVGLPITWIVNRHYAKS